MLFLWVVLFAFYYFAPWHALLQLGTSGDKAVFDQRLGDDVEHLPARV